MPIHAGTETKGGKILHWYQWGSKGAKYFYNPESQRSRVIAWNKAVEQAKAIKASESRRK